MSVGHFRQVLGDRVPVTHNRPDYLDIPDESSPASVRKEEPEIVLPEDDGYVAGLMAGGVVVWGLLVAGGAGLWLLSAEPAERLEAGLTLTATIAVGASIMGLLCFCAAIWLFAGQRRTRNQLERLNSNYQEAATNLRNTEESFSIEKSDHEATLRAARRLAARHDALFHHAPYPVLVVQPDGRRILFANRRAGDLFALSAGELAKRRFSSFVPEPGDYDRLLSLIAGEASEQGLELLMRNGADTALQVHVHAVSIDYDGQQAVYLLMQELGETRGLQSALKAAEARIGAQEAELVRLHDELAEQNEIISSLGRELQHGSR